MDANEEMSLTVYLQTEGRRRAAELTEKSAHSSSALARSIQPATIAEERPPQSLSECLRAMGLASVPRALPARINRHHSAL